MSQAVIVHELSHAYHAILRSEGGWAVIQLDRLTVPSDSLT